MNGSSPSRSAVGAAALCVTVLGGALTGCASPRVDDGARDVRVVDISDEVAEKIAERVAAYLPQPPTGAQNVIIQGTPRAGPPSPPAPRREIAGGARYPSPDPTIFKPVRKVARDRLRTAAAKSVDAALAWLARHQADDGAWYAAAFSEQCEGAKCSGPGEPLYTPGLTGMALLAFLEDGNTHRTGEYADTVRRALRYLTQRLEQSSNQWPEYARYYQAQALFQGDVEAWEKWNKLLIRQLKNAQQSDGSFTGQLGPGISTSMSLLALALNYRFLPIYER